MFTENEFIEILESSSINVKFQPVIDLRDGNILGFEAYAIAAKNDHSYTTKDLVRAAKKLNKLWEFVTVFRREVFKKAEASLGSRLLFIVAEPALLEDDNFQMGFTKSLLANHTINAENLIFEISQKTIVKDYERFLEIHRHYKSQKYRTVVSKVGDSHISLKGVSETKPDFVKIDKKMIADIDTDKHKQTVVKSFVDLSRESHFKIIADGVNTKEELKTLIELGVPYGQGDYLFEQISDIDECPTGISYLINDAKIEIKQKDIFSFENKSVGTLIRKVPVINDDVLCEDVIKHFESSGSNTLSVLHGSKPLGLVSKSAFDAKLSTRYGYSLYCKKPISSVLGNDTLMLDISTPIHDAGRMALQRTNEYDDIMILDKGQYAGIITMKSIISYTIDYEKNIAKSLNPLTLLPGNTAITKKLKDIINSTKTCGVFYADIDKFKAYNDVYGFDAGDSVISLVASILKKIISASYQNSSFVGHVGGDDFIFVVEASEKEYYLLCSQILNEFDEQIKYYFRQTDLDRGYFEAAGTGRKFPLTSITIAGVFGHLSRFRNESDIAKACAYIKGEAKKKPGSNYLLSEIPPENIGNK
ncbi:MAG: GGDEF domain-containing protein [Clostridia bacterium]|nr:GGDEF domain-containing protein [Clostridia bacterium]